MPTPEKAPPATEPLKPPNNIPIINEKERRSITKQRIPVPVKAFPLTARACKTPKPYNINAITKKFSM